MDYPSDPPEEYLRFRAARALRIDIDDPRLQSPYYLNLANACLQAEREWRVTMHNKGFDVSKIEP